jgi:hypothetical protein
MSKMGAYEDKINQMNIQTQKIANQKMAMEKERNEQKEQEESGIELRMDVLEEQVGQLTEDVKRILDALIELTGGEENDDDDGEIDKSGEADGTGSGETGQDS